MSKLCKKYVGLYSSMVYYVITGQSGRESDPNFCACYMFRTSLVWTFEGFAEGNHGVSVRAF